MSSGRSIRWRTSRGGGRSRGRSSNSSSTHNDNHQLMHEMENMMTPPQHAPPFSSENENSNFSLPTSATPDLDRGSVDHHNDIRKTIKPECDTFDLANEAVREITRVIHSKFEYPMYNWKTVPKSVRKMWFQEWKKSFKWEAKHDKQIERNWEIRCGDRVRGLLSKVRAQLTVDGKRPLWIPEHIMEELIEIWNKDDFKKRQEVAKTNRASSKGGMSHTGGSITSSEHKKRLIRQRGVEKVTDFELFVHTHKKKTVDEFVDPRATNAFESFNSKMAARLAEERLDEDYEMSLEEQNALWLEVVGGKNKKGRIFGLGNVAREIDGSSSKTFTPPTPPSDPWMDPLFREEIDRRIAEATEKALQTAEATTKAAEEARAKAEAAFKASEETNRALKERLDNHENLINQLLRDSRASDRGSTRQDDSDSCDDH